MLQRRRRSWRAVPAIVTLLLAFVATPALAAGRAPAVPPLAPITSSLPAAMSGQAYSATLSAEGGTKPYRCAPESLGVGTIKLLASCVISGTAPTVHSQSVTGPFRFKLSDSSKPPKTIEFPSMNFTTSAASFTPRSFDGTYQFTATVKSSFDCADGSPPTSTSTTISQPFTITNGMLAGKLVTVTNDLGSGSVTDTQTTDGLTISSSYLFSRSPSSPNAISVSSIGTGSGTIAGCTDKESETGHGSRTAIGP